MTPEELALKRKEIEEKRRLRREMRRKRTLFYIFCIVLGLILLVGTAYWSYYHSLPLGLGTSRAEGPIVNILLLGVDSGIDQATRSDTMILFSLDKRDGSISALSIPRDTRVTIPGRRGTHRINAAHALGGPLLAVRTVEQLLGVEIPYYVRIDYEGFKAIVDTLGGVVIDVERRMYYEDRAQGLKIDLQRGLQRLNGDQALQYVRYRSDGMGDVSLVDPVQGAYAGRVERQLKFVRALVKQSLSARHLVNAPELISQLLDAVDTNIPPDVALRLLMLVKDASPQDIATAVLPGEGATVGGASYWVVNRPKAQEVINKLIIRRGDMVRVEVLNGNGIDGTASRVADLLRQQGFEVVAVSNADRFDYATTAVIPRQVDLIHAAEQVAGVVGGQVLSASPVARDLRRSTDADVTVILGKDFSI